MEGHERQDGVVEEREAPGHGERKRRDRDRDRDESERPRKERDSGDREWRREREREPRRGHQHRGGSRNRESRERGNNPSSSYDSLASADRKKKRIEEKAKQDSTIFVGDLDPDTTAEQLTGLFCKFGSVVSAKIKENHCYGFVTFEKREAAEAAIATGQNPDGIELINGKQVRILLFQWEL